MKDLNISREEYNDRFYDEKKEIEEISTCLCCKENYDKEISL